MVMIDNAYRSIADYPMNLLVEPSFAGFAEVDKTRSKSREYFSRGGVG
jgi:hypothetical protein